MPSRATTRRHFLSSAGALAGAGALAATSWLQRAHAAAASTAAQAPAAALQVRKLGWAGVLIETASTSLFIDATAPKADKGEREDLLKAAHDANALITHHHGDHFDHDTVARLLGKNGLLVCLRATADWMDRRSLRVQPVDLWQPVFFPRYGDDLVAFAVPAVDGWGIPQASWVIDGGGVRLFHGGDTQWHGQFADIGRAYGPFDAAFLPINGARQQVGRFTDEGVPAVLTPEQAAHAAKSLRARTIVPIHYGDPDPPKYVEVDDALARLRRAAQDLGIPLRPLATGETAAFGSGAPKA